LMIKADVSGELDGSFHSQHALSRMARCR
jgi:hypothetical protein